MEQRLPLEKHPQKTGMLTYDNNAWNALLFFQFLIWRNYFLTTKRCLLPSSMSENTLIQKGLPKHIRGWMGLKTTVLIKPGHPGIPLTDEDKTTGSLIYFVQQNTKVKGEVLLTEKAANIERIITEQNYVPFSQCLQKQVRGSPLKLNEMISKSLKLSQCLLGPSATLILRSLCSNLLHCFRRKKT